MAGTYNGNPLTMAASRVALTEVMTPEVYDHLNAIHAILQEGCTAVIEHTGLPAYVTGVGAKGSVIYSDTPVREYRDSLGIDERITYPAWLVQQNRGVFKSPWSKVETWTTASTHTQEDAQRYVANFGELAAMLTG
jgi:glutamate-1-semialdehyde 2,1-aminomutase